MPGVSAEQVKLAKKIDLLTYLQINEPHELVKPRHGTGEYRTVTHGSLVISNGLWFWNRGQVGGKSAVDYLIKVRGMGFVDAVKTVLGARGTIDYGARCTVDDNVGSVVSHGTVVTRGDMGVSDYNTGTSTYSGVADASPALPVEEKTNTSSRNTTPLQSDILSQSNPSSQLNPPPKKRAFYPPRPHRYSNKSIAYLQKRGISPDVIYQAIKEGILFESRYYNPESKYHNAAVCVFAGKDESGKIVFAAL